MANPVIVKITEKAIEKVASATKSAVINKHRLQGRDFQYLATYRIASQSPPTEEQMLEEGVILFQNHPEQELIEHDANIDVYVYGNKEDGKSEFGKLIIWT
jgi:hypothetical protein